MQLECIVVKGLLTRSCLVAFPLVVRTDGGLSLPLDLQGKIYLGIVLVEGDPLAVEMTCQPILHFHTGKKAPPVHHCYRRHPVRSVMESPFIEKESPQIIQKGSILNQLTTPIFLVNQTGKGSTTSRIDLRFIKGCSDHQRHIYSASEIICG